MFNDSKLDCKCHSLQYELISTLKDTEEYKRSHAIAEAIKFLCNKIKIYEDYESEMRQKQKESDKKLKQSEEEKDKLKVINKKLQDECESLKSSLCLTKSKLETLEKLNSVLEAQIDETVKMEAQKNEDRTLHFNKILNEYKNTFDDLSEENIQLTQKLKVIEEKNRGEAERLLKKLREVEETLNHLAEENKNLKGKQLQYQTLPNCLENKEEIVNFQFNTIENNPLTNSFNKFKGPSLEEIVNEIRLTENEIKRYTNQLREQEIFSKEENKLNFTEITNHIDVKTSYLFDLKSKYNQLYKKVNLIK